MTLKDLAEYQQYHVQATATNYYMEQWLEEPARGSVFTFRTLPGSQFCRLFLLKTSY